MDLQHTTFGYFIIIMCNHLQKKIFITICGKRLWCLWLIQLKITKFYFVTQESRRHFLSIFGSAKNLLILCTVFMLLGLFEWSFISAGDWPIWIYQIAMTHTAPWNVWINICINPAYMATKKTNKQIIYIVCDRDLQKANHLW